MLSVNEEFYSVMGEGIHTGIPMWFVRLQGCSVGCYFCDVRHTWKPWHPNSDEQKIVKRAKEARVQWVAITGGEPYQQNIYRLLKLCKEQGLKTHVETCGAFEMYNAVPDWLSVSPKDLFSKQKTFPEIADRANEIKAIVTQPNDLEYYLHNYHNSNFIIQPVDTKVNDKKLMDFIYKRTAGLPIRIMIQQDKVIPVIK